MESACSNNSTGNFSYALCGIIENSLTGCATFSPPQQDHFIMLYIRSGEGRLTQGNSLWQLETGNLLLLRFGFIPSIQALTIPITFTSFFVSGDCSDFSTVYKLEADSTLAKTIDSLETQGLAAAPSSDFTQLDTFFSKLYKSCCNDNSVKKQCPVYISALKRILDTRFSESLNLDSFSRELHLNKFKLDKEFKKFYDIPPIEYLLNRRIHEACRLLLETELTITSIGSKVGIINTAYFTKVFKKRTGLTPLTYRNRFRRTDFLINQAKKPEMKSS